MITAIIILVIAYIAKAIRDRIKFRPDDFWFIKNKKLQDWVLGRNEFNYDKRSWLTKYIFSFWADGWHFFDSIVMFCLSICLMIISGTVWYSVFAFHYAGGIVFESTYNVKIR